MPKKVIITNAGRLHFNSLKMNIDGGRGCGGVGISLKGPVLKIQFSVAKKITVSGGNSYLRNKIEKFAKDILKYLKIDQGVDIKILEYFQNQVGLGSGTQLGLSVGRGLSILFDKKLSQLQIAQITKRSGVSGIGYYAFSKGGLIIDGGYKMGDNEAKKNFADHSLTPPPLTARYSFPNKWKILLLSPKKSLPKISGLDEGKFFTDNTPIPMEEVGSICTNILMGMIPALQEKDYFKFMEYLSKINYIGTKKIELELNREHHDYFNQNLESLLANKLVRKCVSSYTWPESQAASLEEKYPRTMIPFLALSSLGPTFFSVLLDGYHDLDYIMTNLERNLPNGWVAHLTGVNNKPAKIEIL